MLLLRSKGFFYQKKNKAMYVNKFCGNSLNKGNLSIYLNTYYIYFYNFLYKVKRKPTQAIIIIWADLKKQSLLKNI